jgi:hypothetical protein
MHPLEIFVPDAERAVVTVRHKERYGKIEIGVELNQVQMQCLENMTFLLHCKAEVRNEQQTTMNQS